MNQPLVREIDYQPVEAYLHALSPELRYALLDSAQFEAKLGRYSYLALDPFEILTWPSADTISTFDSLKKILNEYTLDAAPDLPSFQGGLAGFFSYDLARNLEKLPNKAQQDKVYPDLQLGLFDVVVSIDHQLQKTWIISSGLPEKDLVQRRQRAQQRLEWCQKLLENSSEKYTNAQKKIKFTASNFTRAEYERATRRAVEYILQGDIFEVNLSQRFSCEVESLDTRQLYSCLKAVNPAPFSALIKLGKTEIVSSSPERFIKLEHDRVETRPIKGTIKRDQDAQKDVELQHQLLTSEKDRAENIMIVDLMRNDLSRVCRPGTVNVTQLCGLESYATVHHLVSVVEGQLETKLDAIDLLKATFPGGSVTGAPKIRAMEIIDELEPTRRGPYCGCVGYIGFNGAMDTSILIRSYVVQGDEISFQTGGAVVLDSDPCLEYEETELKAVPLLAALKRMSA